ncbi:MAG: metal-dependent hydrolase [Pseudomonadota bacterium]
MDPLTQGALGAALPQALRPNAQAVIAGALGFAAGLAADLDVLVRSASDPLLFLEYHRQFSHSLIFIPLGGLLVALALHWLLGRRWSLNFWQTALLCALGYATHGLLDAATSYGTMLFWPFSDHRVAWRIVSVVDPLFSVPLGALVLSAAFTRKAIYARAGLLWAALYLSLGALQHHGAVEMGQLLAESRGHTPLRIEVKPSFANIVVWKTVYETEDRFYVDAVRPGIAPKVFPGASLPKLKIERDLPWLKGESQQARDVERFGRLSEGYLSPDPNVPGRIIDVRYSMLPNEVAGLWSIELNPNAADGEHVRFRTHRGDGGAALRQLVAMIFTGSP